MMLHPIKAIAPTELGRVSVKLLLSISEGWDLQDAERLTLAGLSSQTTLDRWRQRVERGEGIKLRKDTFERLSYIVGIRKGIEMLVPKEQWNEQIRKPNGDFGNKSALDRMLGGQVLDLAEVRHYFDGLRGVHFDYNKCIGSGLSGKSQLERRCSITFYPPIFLLMPRACHRFFV